MLQLDIVLMYGIVGNKDDIYGRSRSSLKLDREELLKYKNWTTLSKEFFRSRDNNIDVLELIEKYFSIIASLNKWLLDQLIEYHKIEFEEMWKIQDKLKKIFDVRFKKK